LSPATRQPERARRALALYRDHAGEITQVAPWTYAVPSCSGDGLHQVCVRPGHEACTCRDFEHHGAETPCKHIIAALVWRAKSAECAACKVRRLRRELYEVGPDHLTWYEGDELCHECAGRAGVR
jgi:hypothetical protein